MRHRRVPKWVDAAIEPPIKVQRDWPVLSDMIGRLEVCCETCQRHGVYRVDRLVADLGDLSVPQAMDAIAQRAGCHRARNPPSIGDINYALGKCQIKRVV